MPASRARRAVGVLLSLFLIGSFAALPVSAASDPAIPLPASMAAVGDSITQAASTGGSLGADYPANSWATGSNATVNSHFLRLQALNPSLTAINGSVSGAKVADLAGQISDVLALDPSPDLLTVLIGGNDICTPTETTMTSVPNFRTQFQAAMDVVMTASPQTQIYVVSIPRVTRLWELFKGNWWARVVWSAGNVCQSLLANPTSTATADVERRARVHQRNVDFNTVLADVCLNTVGLNCHWDGLTTFNTNFASSDVSGDYFHPSTAGQAKLASTSWTAGYSWQIPPGAEPQARVADLTGSGQNTSSRYWRATVTIAVTTPAGDPLSGATVTGTFSNGGGTKSCITGTAGTCAVTSNSLKRSSVASTTYTLGALTHATHAYVPDQNLATTVTVTRP